MTEDALMLVGRDAGRARDVATTHAHRLRDRDVADAVHVALYDDEPVRDLKETFADLGADVTYAAPLTLGHTHETHDAVPRALSYVPGEVRYCAPPGRSPALTDAITGRTAERVAPDGETTLLLVGFGSSSLPYQRQVVEYHAARCRERADYDEVVTSYLLQNPTVECARYNVSNDRAVAAPLFLAENEMTEREIPAKLELDRGGIAYAAPLGDHEGVTDAIHGEVEKRRALGDAADEDASVPVTGDRQPVATDGEGRP